MKGIETKSFPFELKSVSDDGARLEGVVACYLNIDLCGDMFLPGCFNDHLAFFKSEGVIRDEHCVTTGKIDDASDTPGGLFVKGTILPTTAGKDQAILVKGRAVKRLSIGSRNYGRWADDPEEIKSIWQAHGYTPTEDDLIRCGHGVRVIEKAKPYEASTTWLPTNESTSITSVKSADPRARPTFDQHSAGLLDQLEEFAARAEQVKTLRAADGRGLSKKSLARIGQLQDRLAKLAPPLEAKGAAPAEDTHGIGLALFAEFQAIVARDHGAEV